MLFLFYPDVMKKIILILVKLILSLLFFNVAAFADSPTILLEKSKSLILERAILEKEIQDIIYEFPPHLALEISARSNPVVRPKLRDKKNASFSVNLSMRWSKEFFDRVNKLKDQSLSGKLASCYHGSLIEARLHTSGKAIDLYIPTSRYQIAFDRPNPSHKLNLMGRSLSKITLREDSGSGLIRTLNRELQGFNLTAPSVPIVNFFNSTEVRYKIDHRHNIDDPNSCWAIKGKFNYILGAEKVLITTPDSLAHKLIEENDKVDDLIVQVEKSILPVTHKLFHIRVVEEPEFIDANNARARIRLSFKMFTQYEKIQELSKILLDYKISWEDHEIGRKKEYFYDDDKDFLDKDVCFNEHCFRGLHPDLRYMLALHCKNIREEHDGFTRYTVSLIRDDGTLLEIGGGNTKMHGVRCDNEAGSGSAFRFRESAYSQKYDWQGIYSVPLAELSRLKKFQVTGIAVPAYK
jgi:hypothetical protein